jgi:hypothetical protein
MTPTKDTTASIQEQKTTLVLARTDEIGTQVPVGKPKIHISIPSLLPMLRLVSAWAWAAVGLILISVLSVLFFGGRNQPDIPARVIAPAPPVLGGADRLAFLDAGDIWISNLDGSDLLPVTQGESLQSGLQWDPDGRMIFYRILLTLTESRM